MAVSPYGFYRGTNHLFWRDFEWDWRMSFFGNHRTRTWVNGDCHAYNYGAFHEHTIGVVFGLNDFDESLIADYQYDLWRLAVSLVLIARENNFFKRRQQERILAALGEAYLGAMARFAGGQEPGGIYFNARQTHGPLQKFLNKIEAKQDREWMLTKWTESDGRFNFALEKLDPVADDVREQLLAGIERYVETLDGDVEFGEGFFKVKDVARRVNAGTGSLGVRRYYVLLEGCPHTPRHNVILDVKQQLGPTGFAYATAARRHAYDEQFANEGARYCAAYRALSYHPDDLLGWFEWDQISFGVRELNPWKASFPTRKLRSAQRFASLADQWGEILATAHARGSHASDYDLPAEVTALTSTRRDAFDHTVIDVATGYADVVEADWRIFCKVAGS